MNSNPFCNGKEKQQERRVYKLSDAFSKKQNRAEAIKVSIYEYNEELHLATVRQEGYVDGLVEGLEKGIQQGIQQGKALDILELLEELGEVSEELKDRILGENQTEVLSKWHKWAAKADSMKAFEELIEE